MKRREFIAATAALLVSPRRLRAQGPPRRVGFLAVAIKTCRPSSRCGAAACAIHGWIEGKNLIVDYRSSEGLPSAYRL